ncbi:MAG: NAD(P)H-dependent oxidoreductase [Pseudomonadota bacterium]
MPKKIFVWTAHPQKGSLCEAIADAYETGAQKAGAEIRRMNLADMDFSDGFGGYADAPTLEPDLIAWQEAMAWADHIFIVHPYWWGAMPARAKTVFDRGLTPGFAYKYHGNSFKWDKMLSGKTADAVITSDTPPFYDVLFYRKPARRVLKNQVLGFCGIQLMNIVQFGSVKKANEGKIRSWLSKTERLGTRAAA